MTDDSEIVRLSDRVMAGRHSLTDRARREEIRGRGGKPGSFVFQSGEIWVVGTAGKQIQKFSSGFLVDDQEAAVLVDGVFQKGSKTKRLKMCSIKLH